MRSVRGVRRRREDAGAVAVIVAVLSVVLFGCAALSVDLGDAWARKREVQKQADLAALAGGALLPATPANVAEILQTVANSLNDGDNLAVGQADTTVADLSDGVVTNGEVAFGDDQDAGCTPADGVACTELQLVTPAAHVSFGLARAIGQDSVDVRRTATARVFSALPPLTKTIPYWLPSGCGLGPAEVDTDQGESSDTGSAGTTAAQPATSATGPDVPQGDSVLGGHDVEVPLGTQATISGLTITGMPSNTDRATIRFYAPDWSYSIDFAAQDTKKLTDPLNVPDFYVGSSVTDTPGDWHFYGYVSPNNVGNAKLTSTSFVLHVTGSESPTDPVDETPTDPSVPVGCVGQDRGEFGQLQSPRADESNIQQTLAPNLAKGLDHRLDPFTGVASNLLECDTKSGALADPRAVLDDQPRDGNNCIKGDTGNDGKQTFQGLIGGLDDGTAGRLNAANGHTICPNGTDPTRADESVNGVMINDDVLSCFLTPGHSLTDLTEGSATTDMLDPAVTESPRFVWIPVVQAKDRSQKRFQPLVDFLPGFITDETQTTPASDANGVEVNGGSSVKVLKVFTFNKNALQVDELSPVVPYDPSLGRPIARLVG